MPDATPPLPGRSEIIGAHKAAGGLVAAVLPAHHPRALLRAHGVLPVEVWGPPGVDTTTGDAHLQPYTCPIVRAALSFLSSPTIEPVDLIVAPHACDSTQGLGSLLLDFVPPQAGGRPRPVLTFYLPRAGGDTGVDFLAHEIRALDRALGEVTGRHPSEAELHAAVAAEEEADARFARLLAARARVPLSDADFYRILRAREYLPAAHFAALVDPLLAAPGAAPKGVGVLVSGMLPEPRALLETLTRAGAVVVADDWTCTGRRAYAPGTSRDPWRRIAESLLSGPPDATRGASVEEREAHLLGLAARTGARAAIFHEVKFCEPEMFYVPQLRRALEGAGLRTLVLETDPVAPLPDQAVTRIEALLETLS